MLALVSLDGCEGACPNAEEADSAGSTDSELPDGGCGQRTLSVVGASSRRLESGDQEALRVALREQCVGPVPGETIAFAIEGDPRGSSLSAASAPTDSDGLATVTLTAHVWDAQFEVRALHADCPEGVSVHIQVDGGQLAFTAIGDTHAGIQGAPTAPP